jgi:hypothetical protein
MTGSLGNMEIVVLFHTFPETREIALEFYDAVVGSG